MLHRKALIERILRYEAPRIRVHRSVGGAASRDASGIFAGNLPLFPRCIAVATGHRWPYLRCFKSTRSRRRERERGARGGETSEGDDEKRAEEKSQRAKGRATAGSPEGYGRAASRKKAVRDFTSTYAKRRSAIPRMNSEPSQGGASSRM